MARLLGSARIDTCRGCIAGREAKGPGTGKPHKRNQRVIQVRKSKFVMMCGVCGTRNERKLNRADMPSSGVVTRK